VHGIVRELQPLKEDRRMIWALVALVGIVIAVVLGLLVMIECSGMRGV
jgi:hypothetical protein